MASLFFNSIRPNSTSIVKITRFGLLLESLLPAPYKILPMTDVVAELLSDDSTLPPLNISTLMTPALQHIGSTAEPESTLVKLKFYLDEFAPAQTDSRTNRIEGLAYGLTILAFIFTCIRIYAQSRIIKRLRLHDYLILLSTAFSILIAALSLHAAYECGLGQHVYHISFDSLVKCMKITLASIYIVQPATFIIRCSLVLYFMTLMPGRKVYRLISLGSIALMSALMFVGVFVATFGCRPLEYWKNFLQAKCIAKEASFTVRFLSLTATDLLVLALSIPVVRDQKLNRREKIVVGFMYVIGLICCGASGLRLASLSTFVSRPDKTYIIAPAIIWTFVEVNLGIIVSCIPLMKSCVLSHRPCVLGYYKRSAGVALTRLKGRAIGNVQETRRSSAGESDSQSQEKGKVSEDRTEAQV